MEDFIPTNGTPVHINGLTPDRDPAAVMAEEWLRFMLRLRSLAQLAGIDAGNGLTWRRVGRQAPSPLIGAPPVVVPSGWALCSATQEVRFEGPRFAGVADRTAAIDAAADEIKARTAAVG